MNRSIQVEGAFGVLKSDYEFNGFLTRGKNSVKTEFILFWLQYQQIAFENSKSKNSKSSS